MIQTRTCTARPSGVHGPCDRGGAPIAIGGGGGVRKAGFLVVERGGRLLRVKEVGVSSHKLPPLFLQHSRRTQPCVRVLNSHEPASANLACPPSFPSSSPAEPALSLPPVSSNALPLAALRDVGAGRARQRAHRREHAEVSRGWLSSLARAGPTPTPTPTPTPPAPTRDAAVRRPKHHTGALRLTQGNETPNTETRPETKTTESSRPPCAPRP